MRRRHFIALLGTAAATWPCAAHAQQQSIPVVGLLHGASQEKFAANLAAFKQGLSQTGFIDGKNVTIDPPFASRENSVRSCSIAAVSSASIGFTSTPSDGAIAWTAPSCPPPLRAVGSRMTATRVMLGANFLEQLEPLCADPEFKLGEASCITAWSSQACN